MSAEFPVSWTSRQLMNSLEKGQACHFQIKGGHCQNTVWFGKEISGVRRTSKSTEYSFFKPTGFCIINSS